MAEYVQVLSKWGNSQLQVVLELLQHEVCPRCCLRFSGIGPSNTIYQKTAPTPQNFQAAIQKHLKITNGQEVIEQGSDEQQKVCPLCMDILRSMDGLSNHLHDKKAFMSDAQQDTWTFISGFQKDSLLQLLAQRELKKFMFKLDVKLFGSVALREKCMWRHLQKQKQLNMQGLQYSQLTDIREIVKFVATQWLEKDTDGKACNQNKADIELVICMSQPGGYLELFPFIKLCHKHLKHSSNKFHGKRKSPNHNPEPLLFHLSKSAKWIDYNHVDKAMTELEQELNHNCVIFEALGSSPEYAAKIGLKLVTQGYYLGGRYLKLGRGIPQSPMFHEGAEEAYPVTVSGVITDVIKKACSAQGCVFSAAGREDIDVRMLGNGRPFIVFVQSPGLITKPSQEQLDKIQEEINTSKVVRINKLQLFSEEMTKTIKEGEEEKEKTYGAVCWTARPITDEDITKINSTTDLKIQQNTPIRVLHSRASMEREKHIHKMEIKKIQGQNNYFQLAMRTQAGTYIKEFVSGNFGRSHPSLSSLLGCRVELQQLDVLDVHLDVLLD